MTRPTPNLAPLPHRIARTLRKRRLFWITAGGTYTALLLAAAGTYWALYVPNHRDAGAELAALRSRNQETRVATERVAVQIASVRSSLDYRRSMAQQPDFSVLLQLISDAVDRDTVLRQLSLKGSGVDILRASPPQPGTEREPKHFLLTLRGSSRGESGVSRLSARLREAGVFDHVELRRTGRDAGSDGESVAFEIDCLLSDTPSATSSGAPVAGGVP